jgi:hypothetical protein
MFRDCFEPINGRCVEVNIGVVFCSAHAREQ